MRNEHREHLVHRCGKRDTCGNFGEGGGGTEEVKLVFSGQEVYTCVDTEPVPQQWRTSILQFSLFHLSPSLFYQATGSRESDLKPRPAHDATKREAKAGTERERHSTTPPYAYCKSRGCRRTTGRPTGHASKYVPRSYVS